MLNYKKGEIGESITWVVATVIIIVVLIIFIYASSVLAALQSISVTSGERKFSENNYLDFKTGLAFGQNDKRKTEIIQWIKIDPLKEDNNE